MANTYKTLNPVGSTSVKDLNDNASNFDDGMNGLGPSFQDRFSKRRLSWAGFEARTQSALDQLGYVFTTPLDYAAGITISLPNQIFRNGGEYYKALPTLDLPYTTTGVWADESSKFVSVGDAALRSQLAANDGAELIGHKRAEPGAVLRTVGSILGEHRSVSDFGVLGDGSDETALAQAALDSFPSNGGALFWPMAVRVSSIEIPDYVHIYGGGAIIFTGTSGDLSTLGVTSKIVDMSVTHAGDPTGTVMLRLLGTASAVTNCTITNYHQGIVVGTLSVNVVDPLVDENNMFSPHVAAGSGAVFFQNYSNGKFFRNVISGASYPSLQPDYGLRLHNGDTFHDEGNNITAHGIALYMDVPVGLHNYAARFVGSLFDSAGVRTGQTIVDSATIIPAGKVLDMLFTSCWFGLSKNGNGLQINRTGAGSVNGACFNNCQYVGNAIAGFEVVSDGVINVQFIGGYSTGNSVYGGTFGPNVTKFKVIGMDIGNVAERGPNGRGLNVDDGLSDYYTIELNTIQGNTVFNFYDGGAGTHKLADPARNIIAA